MQSKTRLVYIRWQWQEEGDSDEEKGGLSTLLMLGKWKDTPFTEESTNAVYF